MLHLSQRFLLFIRPSIKIRIKILNSILISSTIRAHIYISFSSSSSSFFLQRGVVAAGEKSVLLCRSCGSRDPVTGRVFLASLLPEKQGKREYLFAPIDAGALSILARSDFKRFSTAKGGRFLISAARSRWKISLDISRWIGTFPALTYFIYLRYARNRRRRLPKWFSVEFFSHLFRRPAPRSPFLSDRFSLPSLLYFPSLSSQSAINFLQPRFDYFGHINPGDRMNVLCETDWYRRVCYRQFMSCQYLISIVLDHGKYVVLVLKACRWKRPKKLPEIK